MPTLCWPVKRRNWSTPSTPTGDRRTGTGGLSDGHRTSDQPVRAARFGSGHESRSGKLLPSGAGPRNSSMSVSAGKGATGASSWRARWWPRGWVSWQAEGRRFWRWSTPPALRRASAVRNPTRPPRRWPGTRPWAAQRKVIRRPWPTITSSTIRIVRGACRVIAPSWPGMSASRSVPGHCANLMNPGFRELGAAYAMDPKSDAGIYWTAMFGTQQQ